MQNELRMLGDFLPGDHQLGEETCKVINDEGITGEVRAGGPVWLSSLFTSRNVIKDFPSPTSSSFLLHPRDVVSPRWTFDRSNKDPNLVLFSVMLLHLSHHVHI